MTHPICPDCGTDRITELITYCPLHKSAPSLLAALESMTAWAQTAEDSHCDIPWPGHLNEATDLARAAIEAAKGEAND